MPGRIPCGQSSDARMNGLNFLQMNARSKSAIALVLALAVFACSAQSAFCELACGLRANSVPCHRLDAPSSMTQMALGQSHCRRASHARAAAPAVGTTYDGPCGHSAEPAIVTEVCNHLSYASVPLPIIALLPSASVLHGKFRIRDTSPSLRPPPFDPLLAALRV